MSMNPYTPDKKPLNDLLARVQALDSANKESSKRKRQEKDDIMSKKVNDWDSPDKSTAQDVSMDDESDTSVPAMPYADHHAAYPTIFRATPKNLSVKSTPPNFKTHIYKRPSMDISSEHSSSVHPDTKQEESADEDDVILIHNLTPKKQYTPNKATSDKFRGGRISEAYKMTPRRKITREMLLPDEEVGDESIEKENDDMQS